MNERLQRLAIEFFARILKLCDAEVQSEFIVVTHLLEDRPWFLQAVGGLGRVAAVIPKKKSIVPRVRDILKHRYPMLDLSRPSLSTPEGIRRAIGPHVRGSSVCMLDIGGYFEHASFGVEGLGIAAIVEDTENGHKRYLEKLANANAGTPVPIASVARSSLKRPENYLVGQSLVYSVEAVLRDLDELLHGRRCCVIGYGNIGRSIAQHLLERRAHVVVYDRDPLKRVEAFTHGFVTTDTSIEAVRDAEIVFCATGSRSIGTAEIAAMRERAYVATVTSPDDEFDPEVLNLRVSHRPRNVSEYRRADGSVIYLMNRGQAVNFLHGSVVGPFIQLLQAEILVTASRILSARLACPRGEIVAIGREDQEAIATEWLKVYKHR